LGGGKGAQEGATRAAESLFVVLFFFCGSFFFFVVLFFFFVVLFRWRSALCAQALMLALIEGHEGSMNVITRWFFELLNSFGFCALFHRMFPFYLMLKHVSVLFYVETCFRFILC
jgi:hypothetical protein